MQFGLYCPIPMTTTGSPEIADSVAHALEPLPAGAVDQQYEHGLKLLQAADVSGFSLALFAERHLGHDMSAWVLAGAIASKLDNIRALVASHPGLWDPVMVAKLAVSLDRMCKGRMAINIVNGWFDQEFEMFGGTVLKDEQRYKRTGEFIDIMRGLWSNDAFTYHGEHYKVENAQLLLKPAGPPPEIFSVSTSDRGLDFIADYCDWWFVEIPKQAETTAESMRLIEASTKEMRARAERRGRKVRLAMNPFLHLGDNPDHALDGAIKTIFKYDSNPDERKLRMRMIPATRAGLMGTPQDVLAQIQRYTDMGIEMMLLKMIPNAENIQNIGRKVIAHAR